MMDCTDRHDRFFLRLMSKNVMLYTEMVATKSAIHGDRKKILGFNKIEKPLALVFGNEHRGLDKPWYNHIDTFFTIPMYGMVESLNISVAAAICMQMLSSKLRDSSSLINEEKLIGVGDQKDLLNQWVCEHFPNWQRLYEETKKKS